MVSILAGCQAWGLGDHFYVTFLHDSEHSEHILFFAFLVGKRFIIFTDGGHPFAENSTVIINLMFEPLPKLFISINIFNSNNHV